MNFRGILQTTIVVLLLTFVSGTAQAGYSEDIELIESALGWKKLHNPLIFLQFESPTVFQTDEFFVRPTLVGFKNSSEVANFAKKLRAGARPDVDNKGIVEFRLYEVEAAQQLALKTGWRAEIDTQLQMARIYSDANNYREVSFSATVFHLTDPATGAKYLTAEPSQLLELMAGKEASEYRLTSRGLYFPKAEEHTAEKVAEILKLDLVVNDMKGTSDPVLNFEFHLPGGQYPLLVDQSAESLFKYIKYGKPAHIVDEFFSPSDLQAAVLIMKATDSEKIELRFLQGKRYFKIIGKQGQTLNITAPKTVTADWCKQKMHDQLQPSTDY